MTADFPRLYAIVDASFFRDCPDPISALTAYARELIAGGATLIQYRNKQGSTREMLSQARELARLRGTGPLAREIRFIMNDRADLCLAAGFDGVHVGQDDLSPAGARAVVGDRPWVGVSTHNIEQVREADSTHPSSAALREGGAPGTVELPTLSSLRSDKRGAPGALGLRVRKQDALAQDDNATFGVDYIAIGPVFATTTKANPDPVIGLEGVGAARQATRKPLVAIGGITRANCRAVIEAGADSVAVISDLRSDPRKAVEEFLRVL